MLVAWQELLLGLVICLAVALAGAALLRAVLGRVTFLDSFALAFPLGAGLLTWLLFLLSWVGVALSLLTGAVACLLLIALAVLARAVIPRAEHSPSSDSQLHRRSTVLTRGELAILSVSLLAATAFAAWLGISGSYYGWDDMAIWAVKGYGIAREGSIWAAGTWGDHGLGYPQNIPLLIALFRFTGDALPASKLIFPLFYLSACTGCLRFWLDRGVTARTAALGTLALATTPILVQHATLGYANLPYATYLMLAIAESTQGIMARDARRQALGGALLGLAAWTRPEGTLVVALVMVVMAVVAWRVRPGSLRPLAWALPTIVIGGAWTVFARLYAPGGQMPQAIGAALQEFGQGRFHLGALTYIMRFMARQTLEVSVWGILSILCAGLLILGLRRLGPRSNPDAFLVASVLLAVAGGSTAHYYLADFVGKLVKGMSNSANRMYIPVAVLAALLAMLLTRVNGNRRRDSDGRPAAPLPDDRAEV